MSKSYQLLRYAVRDVADAERFEQDLGRASKDGRSIEACGMSSDCGQAWAILSKPANEPPKKIDMLGAARLIAETCRARGEDGCMGCPLSRGNTCLASGSRVPGYWDIMKGV